MEARPAYELVSTQTGTEVRHTAEGRLFGIFGLMKPVEARVARGERKRTVEALKASLEQDDSSIVALRIDGTLRSPARTRYSKPLRTP
jgi:hypothetical protein